jgi:hypothetical protein
VPTSESVRAADEDLRRLILREPDLIRKELGTAETSRTRLGQPETSAARIKRSAESKDPENLENPTAPNLGSPLFWLT